MNDQIEDLGSIKAQLRYIYNSYRTALLNRKYYGYRLTSYQQFNFFLEIAIAVGATGSAGVAGLAIWGTLAGQYAWLAISGFATVLGVVKPVLQLAPKIENYTKLYVGHSAVYLDLKSIIEDIEILKSIPENILQQYGDIRKKIGELGGLDDPRPDRVKIKQFQNEVNEEIPLDSLWFPNAASAPRLPHTEPLEIVRPEEGAAAGRPAEPA